MTSPSGYPDPFREGNIGSGPQSLSLSQGSIGGSGGALPGSAGLGAAGMGGSGGAVATGLVKYESDTSGLSLHQHHLPSQVSPTQSQHPRVHRRNVSDTSAFNKTFASETTQFLAPFETSVKSAEREAGPASTPRLRMEGLVSSDVNLAAAEVRAWNPFNDMTPFSQMSEDHIFGAEFDKIRRGSQSSISNVKSRESLVMSTEDDPFGAAPFSIPGSRRGKSTGKNEYEGRMNSTEEVVTSPTEQASGGGNEV
ncbi:AP2-associated protein kinase 1 [Penaeus vannamei]|uniref:AP2-associated protein kinase 1 n=1 Tax=Penaeus vannamei TaxID=6689 RepID=A0A3R7PBN9_PENVA|nr:AP2-associated protein kinase 1 [Penaeus vannamei]